MLRVIGYYVRADFLDVQYTVRAEIIDREVKSNAAIDGSVEVKQRFSNFLRSDRVRYLWNSMSCISFTADSSCIHSHFHDIMLFPSLKVKSIGFAFKPRTKRHLIIASTRLPEEGTLESAYSGCRSMAISSKPLSFSFQRSTAAYA